MYLSLRIFEARATIPIRDTILKVFPKWFRRGYSCMCMRKAERGKDREREMEEMEGWRKTLRGC